MEILGILDTLESVIIDSPRVPFTKKLLVDEDKVLKIIDKLRNVISSGGESPFGRGSGKKAGSGEESVLEAAENERKPQAENKAVEVIEQAYQMAKEIREGADKYADEVLANLEATSARILRTIKAGRDRLSKTAPAKAEK
jgi:cell division septum initiation protein DivIVA